MFTNKWFQTMRERYMPFPSSYFTFDVETSGVNPDSDLILQFGHCIVDECRPVHRYSVVLDWTRYKEIDQAWLKDRLDRTCYEMGRKGMTYQFSYDRLAREGVDPFYVLRQYHEMFRQRLEDGGYFVTHNGVAYDCRIFVGHINYFLGEKFAFHPSSVLDTGMAEKACQLELYPQYDESLFEFYGRMSRLRRKGILWSLDRTCIPKYNLVKRYKLDAEQAHDAGFDAYVTHLVFEEHRRMSGDKRGLYVPA